MGVSKLQLSLTNFFDFSNFKRYIFFFLSNSLILFQILKDYTAQKMKFSIQNIFSKCDQIRKKLRIWSHLRKKSLIENLVFCAVLFFIFRISFVLYSDLHFFNLFVPNAPFLYHLKTSENLRFSDVFRGYRQGALETNGLIHWLRTASLSQYCQKNYSEKDSQKSFWVLEKCTKALDSFKKVLYWELNITPEWFLLFWEIWIMIYADFISYVDQKIFGFYEFCKS